jgi:5-methylcytosine-specific restriction endonuclease McrA
MRGGLLNARRTARWPLPTIAPLVILTHTAEVDDALMVRRVGELILAGKRVHASELLASVPEEDRIARTGPRTVTQEKVLAERDRRRVSAAQMFAVHERYGWRCQYCGRRVVIAGVIELVGRLCREVRWWPNDNMPKPLTHPAAERLYPNADHIKARAVGGHATADDNLICSCTTCNERKGSRGGWQPIVPSEPWDGCVPLFAPLYDLASAQQATLTEAVVDWLDAARRARASTAVRSSQPARAPSLPHPVGATAARTRKRPQSSLDEKLMNAGADVLDAAERLRVLGDEIGVPVAAAGASLRLRDRRGSLVLLYPTSGSLEFDLEIMGHCVAGRENWVPSRRWPGAGRRGLGSCGDRAAAVGVEGAQSW